ncbi:hypothetical protein [Streptomyces roseicoloratus]|uniref:hypothetical protein n=1 Tax=Streptomyces roseicoloratus TaxID=2508722 RepID=UPI001009EF6D|nr:hypothetical protein [Streptomyces roseicoloratus]
MTDLHATAAETIPALMASIQEYRALQQPLVDALRLIHEDMDRAHKGGDEWAMEWMGDVWSGLPLAVRAAAGDQDAAHEYAAGVRDAARQATAQPATEAVCACGHAAHAPGTECEDGVNHGSKRWHRCLCLNLVDADSACPPDMDCQGGTLGYSDVWHRQRAAAPNAALGITTEQALRGAAALGEAIRATQPSGVDFSSPSVGRQDTQTADEEEAAAVLEAMAIKLATGSDPVEPRQFLAAMAAYRAAILNSAADEIEQENASCNSVVPCQPCATRTHAAASLRGLAVGSAS